MNIETVKHYHKMKQKHPLYLNEDRGNKMKKRTLSALLAGLLSLSLSACQPAPQKESVHTDRDEPRITLTIRNPKVEISTQFEQMAIAYEKGHPNVKIDIHTVGGAVDDFSDLKAEIAAGTGPDIFTNSGYETAKEWQDYLEDLSDEPWVKHAYEEALTPMTFDGKIHGMPMNLEGYGFIYNKDLFQKAGIDTVPTTLTDLTEAAQKLQKAGITPFATGYYEEWKLGDHLMNVAFAQQKDPAAFIQSLNNGKETIQNNPAFHDLLNLLDVTLKYGNRDPLTTDYNMEVNLFASGRAAMIQQGNWIQPMIDQQSPHMNIGFLPIPLNDHTKSKLVVSVPNYWVINKQSSPAEKKAAKEFLNWMVSTKQGQIFMTDRFKFIPAFKHIKADHLGPLADETIYAYKEGDTLHANWFHFPSGIKEEFGAAMQLYIGKQLPRKQLLDEFQKSWEKASNS